MENLITVSRQKLGPIFLLAVLVSVVIFYMGKIITHEYYRSDFVSFYSSAQILRDNPQQLYDFATQKQYQLNLLPEDFRQLPGNHFYPFINPPIFLLPHLPLLDLPPQQAYRLMMASIGLMMAGCLWILAKLFPLPRKKLVLLVLVMLAYAPTFTTIYLTQSSFTSLLVFVATYWLLIRKQWFLSGLAASLLVYKPQLGMILYLYLLLQANWSLIWGMVTGAASWLVLSWVLSKGYLFSLVWSLPEFTQQIGAGPKIRITWLGFFHQLADFIPPLPYQALTYVFSAVTIILVLKVTHKIKLESKKLPLAFSLIIVATLLGSIHAHYQETVLLFFPLMFFMQKLSTPRVYLIAALGWLTYLLAIFNPWFPQPLLFLPTLYLVLIFYLMVRKLKFSLIK